MPQPYKPAKDREKERLRRELEELGREPDKEEKKLLFKTTLGSSNADFLASDLFSSVLSSLPVTLHIKTEYKSVITSRHDERFPNFIAAPEFEISIKTEGFLGALSTSELYKKTVYEDLEEEFDVLIPSVWHGKKVKNILIRYEGSNFQYGGVNYTRHATLHLEVYELKK
jgi:hypothetical protein